jgi:hypothetical protein
MISLIVHDDRIVLNNAMLKDHALEVLHRNPTLANEFQTMLYQYRNKKDFIYFLFPENIPVAVRLLREGHEAYLKNMGNLIEQNRKYNLKLQPKPSTPPERQETVMSREDAYKFRVLQIRSKPEAGTLPFRWLSDLFRK